MHFHAEEIFTLIGGGFGAMILSYAVRTFPKPRNAYALWLLGVIQFILLNVEQGKSNFQTMKDQGDMQAVVDSKTARDAIARPGTGSGTGKGI